MADTPKRRILKSAEKLLGRKELAGSLKVTEGLLEAWIEGAAEMPDRKLSLLADVLEKFANEKPK